LINSYTYNPFTKLALKVFAFIALIICVFLLGQVVSYFKSGADPNNVLNLTSKQLQHHTPFCEWNMNDAIIGGDIDAFTQQEIEQEYLNAWQMLNLSMRHKTTEQLEDYFSDSLIVKIAAQLSQSNQIVEQVDISHHITPLLSTLDKHLFVFDDNCIEIKKRIYSEDKEEIRAETTDFINVKVAMKLIDGRWKIHHFVRQNSADCNKVNSDKNVTALEKIQHIKGINYYPANYPWHLFWTNYDPTIIKQDLALVKSLGFNSVRFFIPFTLFSGNDIQPKLKEHLRSFLDLIEEANMTCMPTLFDFPIGFSWDVYTRSDKYLHNILKLTTSHPSVIAFDIKNEADLDIDLYKQEVEDWLDFVIKRFKVYAPQHICTVGWSSAEASIQHSGIGDFISFHHYRSPEELDSAIVNLKRLTVDKPILLSEFGHHSYNSWFYPIGQTEKQQFDYTQEVIDVLDKHQVAYYFWTLYDFQDIPSSVVGRLPWRKNMQKHYGIFDAAGKKKKVALVFEE